MCTLQLKTSSILFEKLLLIALFIRDVARPLQLTLKPIKKMTKLISKGAELRSDSTLVYLLTIIHGDEFKRLSSKLNETGKVLVSRFLDTFITDFILSSDFAVLLNKTKNLESKLLSSLIRLIAWENGTGKASRKVFAVDLSEATRVSMMRDLMDLETPEMVALVNEHLVKELARSVHKTGLVDNLLCVSYASVEEQRLRASFPTSSQQANNMKSQHSIDRLVKDTQQFLKNQFDLLLSPPDLTDRKNVSAVKRFLKAVAIARTIVSRFARLLCDNLEELEEDMEAEAPYCRICEEEADEDLGPLIAPCLCKGAGRKYVHAQCLVRWQEMKRKTGRNPDHCDTCKYRYDSMEKSIARAQEPDQVGADTDWDSIVGALSHLKYLDTVLYVPRIKDKGKSKKPLCFVPSMRMFFLKCVERFRGVSFLQTALLLPPTCGSRWFTCYKAEGDANLLRFLCNNKLPSTNPFASHHLFKQLSECVTRFMGDGNLDALAATLADMARTRSRYSVCVGGSFMLALYYACYLLRVVGAHASTTLTRLKQLQKWIASTDVLRFMNEGERTLLQILCGTDQIVSRSGEVIAESANLFGAFSVHSRSSPERIALSRVAVHHAAVAHNASRGDKSDIGHFFHALMYSPHSMRGRYFPQMPEDQLAMAQKVLGGRWYRCPNGHAYYVDLCGRPTVVNKCATCGAKIGGTNHNLIGDNEDIGATGTGYHLKTAISDNSEPNYLLRPAKDRMEQEMLASVRDMNPQSCRLQRLFIHLSFAIGGVLGNSEWAGKTIQVLNPTYTGKLGTKEELVTFFDEHVQNDWKILKGILQVTDDDVAMIMHETLITIDQQATKAVGGKPARTANVKKKASLILKTRPARDLWEKSFLKIYAKLVDSDGVEDRMAKCAQKHAVKKGSDASVFTQQLRDHKLATIDIKTRRLEAPALWRHRRQFTMQEFIVRLQVRRGLLRVHHNTS